jgi:hypothetical protein
MNEPDKPFAIQLNDAEGAILSYVVMPIISHQKATEVDCSELKMMES